MKNWKRYLSVAMTLVMLLGVLPTAAFAEGETVLTKENVTVEAATYNGTVQKPVIKTGDITLSEDDYTYSVEGDKELKNAGDYSLTITGKGAYSGSVQETFQINPKPISDLDISVEATEQIYNGEAKTPAVTVKHGETITLQAGTDYSLAYTQNTNAGKEATVTITALNPNYSGDAVRTFEIKPMPVEASAIDVTNLDITYGDTIEPTVTYKKDADNTITLVKNTDYTISYSGTDAGRQTATVILTGNYSGTKEQGFTITPKAWSVDGIEVTGVDSQGKITYSGSAPVIQVKAGTAAAPAAEYTLTYKKGEEILTTAPSNVGKYTVIASPTANYTGEAKSAEYEIVEKTLSGTAVADIAAQTYTGSALTPAVTVKDGETTLTLNTDYTVTYSNNTNAGTASATVKFKGNYTGADVTKTFTISPKDISTAVLGGLNSTYNPGSSPRPTVTLDGKTLEEGTDYDLDYDRNTSGSLGIKVDGKGNYTGTKQATVAVLATSDTTAPVISGVSNGGTYNEAKTITVTDTNLEKVEIYQGTTLVNNLTPAAGTTTVSTTLALSDTAYVIKAYDKVGNKTEFTVTVTRKSITASMITIADADNIVFDGTAKTPAITVKDGTTTIAADQYTLSWENNTNAGTATVKVTMKSDATAYKGEATKTFTIKAKTITSSSAIADIADQTYTGSPLTPTITVKDGTTTLVMGSDKDYTVIYSDNTNPGTAKVTVVLRGNYLGVLQKTFTINPNLTVLADNIKTLAAKTTLTYAEQQQAKQLKAAYDSLSAENKAIVDAAVGTTLMASFKNKVSAAAYKLLNKPAVGYYKHVQGTSSNVAIKIDADFSRTLVTEIRMGKYDTVIDPANYTVTEGSVVVTLSSSYLKTIKTTGKYNLYIDLTDIQTGHTETLQTVVRIVPATDIPQTGDPFRMNLWIGLLGASVLALAGLGVYEVLKKKKNSQKRLEAAMDLGENADKVDIPE